MSAGVQHGIAADVVELNHTGAGGLKNILGTSAVPVSRRDESRAKSFREHQLVPWSCRGVSNDFLRMDDAGDRQTELNLGVPDGVASDNDRAGRLAALRTSPQDFSQPVHAFFVIGIADEI